MTHEYKDGHGDFYLAEGLREQQRADIEDAVWAIVAPAVDECIEKYSEALRALGDADD